MTITVYTKPGCGACVATHAALAKEGLDHQLVDLTTDPTARQIIQGLGYLQAPVVVAGEDHWSGFQLDRIKALRDHPPEAL